MITWYLLKVSHFNGNAFYPIVIFKMLTSQKTAKKDITVTYTLR